MRNKLLIIFSISLLLLVSCNKVTKKQNSLKASLEDPFLNSITESQYFEIDTKKDHIVEGQKGTLLILPKGCFIDKNGLTVTKNITVELVESLDLEEMILSNLTTTSNGQLLETDGMIYISAKANGEELNINKEIPIHIEIPTSKRKEGMMAYKGIRDEQGNMNWVEPQKIDNYLIPVDMKLLDFFPEGFEDAVKQGMPFKNYNKANPKLVDSLYYSLSIQTPVLNPNSEVSLDINEPYYNSNSQVVYGKYTDESFVEE